LFKSGISVQETVYLRSVLRTSGTRTFDGPGSAFSEKFYFRMRGRRLPVTLELHENQRLNENAPMFVSRSSSDRETLELVDQHKLQVGYFLLVLQGLTLVLCRRWIVFILFIISYQLHRMCCTSFYGVLLLQFVKTLSAVCLYWDTLSVRNCSK